MLELLPEDGHWWFAGRTRALQAILDPFWAVYAADKGTPMVLDVGCGAGNMAHHLGQYGQVVGFDPFPAALAIAAERGGVVALAEADRLPFAAQQFDLVAALDVIEHCDDDRVVASELFRVTKPGGALLVSVPAFQWLWSYNDVVNQHRRRYSAPQLRDLLSQAGFRVRRIGFNNFFVFPLAAALTIARNRRDRRKLSAPITDGAYQVEMEPTTPTINRVLHGVGRIEEALIRRLDLPIGTGILCLAERP